MAATLWMVDGFEHGVAGGTYVYDQAALGTPTIDTTTPKHGLRCLEISAAALNELVRYNPANTIVTMAFYLYFPSATGLPGANVTLARWTNANGNGLFQWNAATSKVTVTAGTGPTVDGGPTMTTNTWYRVVAELDCSGASAILRCVVDGGTEFSSTGTQASANITAAALGTGSSHTYTARYDDWLISVTDTDYEEIKTWGEWQVLSMRPSSDGTHNITTSGDFNSFSGTNFSNSTTNGWSFIAHRPLQAANTANQVVSQILGATTNYMEFLFENLTHPSGFTPLDVRTYAGHVEAATTGASLGQMQLLLSDNTEVLTTGSISMIESTEDPGTTVTGRHRMAIRPAGGWDTTKLDGLKVRVGFADGAPDVNFIDSMVEILYYKLGATDLVVQDATSASNSDNVALTQVHVLTVADATSASNSDNVALGVDLVIQDATSASTSDNVALTQTHVLAVQDATSASTSDNVNLTQVHVLAVQDATSASTGENVALTQTHVLVVQDATSASTGENVVLGTSSAIDLVVQDAVSASTSENVVITQVHQLTIADATSASLADNVDLTQIHILVVQDAVSPAVSDNVLLSIPGEATTGGLLRLRHRPPHPMQVLP